LVQACKTFDNDGRCEAFCPPQEIYSDVDYKYVPNPDAKFSYGSLCVARCPCEYAFCGYMIRYDTILEIIVCSKVGRSEHDLPHGVLVRYYLLEGDTVALSGLYATLSHTFLVYFLFAMAAGLMGE